MQLQEASSEELVAELLRRAKAQGLDALVAWSKPIEPGGIPTLRMKYQGSPLTVMGIAKHCENWIGRHLLDEMQTDE